MTVTFPNGPDTHFGYSSVGKMFTAVAIVQLAESGKLDYADPISHYLPDYPAAVADQVTIDQLLTHRSGIADSFADWVRFQDIQANINPQPAWPQLRYRRRASRSSCWRRTSTLSGCCIHRNSNIPTTTRKRSNSLKHL